MKTGFPGLVMLLLVGTGLSMAVTNVAAETYNQLKSFAPTAPNSAGVKTNVDGANPQAELIGSGEMLYGVAAAGGRWGAGTLFGINRDGSDFSLLKEFSATALNASTSLQTNSDGAAPQARLFQSDDTLYGTAPLGGRFGFGTVFKVRTNGTGFTVIRSFAGGTGDGANPYGGVVVPGDTVYGTTAAGGNTDSGVLFRVETDGSGFAIVHHFGFGATNGVMPRAEVLRSGDTLFGTTFAGGSGGWGTVFKVNTNGAGFSVLKGFPSADPGTNSDGATPWARLILADGMLYGTTYRGGAYSNGTVFKVSTSGTGFAVLKTFNAIAANPFGQRTNLGGANSQGRLVLSGSTLYGTTLYGGAGGAGTIFQLNTNGSGFAVLRDFAEINGFGGVPSAGLLLLGGTFYGTTQFGGEGNSGTLFSLTLPGPQLSINRSGSKAILSWPGDDTGYTLESAASLGPAAIWNPVSPPPVNVSGRNTVTNPIAGSGSFYRLTQ